MIKSCFLLINWSKFSVLAAKNNQITSLDCDNNNHCYDSSFCCSRGKCVDSVTCTFGLKRVKDNCDFRYECSSRCCHENKCNDKVSECKKQCKSND